MIPKEHISLRDINETMLVEENKRLRLAGTTLSKAALHVITEYDGLHRLSLAVSEWAKTLADEHGRNKPTSPPAPIKK